MIHVCERLKKVLGRIRNLLESGEYEHLPEHMSERMMLIQRLQECKPDKSRLGETIQLLKFITKEERFLMELADAKKADLQHEMKIFQTQRVAVAKYHTQSHHRIFGVQP